MGQSVVRIKEIVINQILNLMILPVIVISSLILAVNPLIAAALFFLGAVFLFILFYPVITLYLLIFTNTFDTLARLSVDSIVTLTKIFTLILSGVLVLKVILKKDQAFLKNIFNNPLSVAALFFLFTQIVSIIHATDLKMLIIQVIRMCSFVVLYYIIVNLVTDKAALKKFLLVLLIAFMIAAWMGIYEILTGVNILVLRWGADINNSSLATGTLLHKAEVSQSSNPAISSQMLRISGVQGSPDFLAFAMIFPSVLSFLFFYLYKSWFARIAMVGFFFLFVLNILGTVTRGGVIALGISIVVFWHFLKVRHKPLITFAVVIAFLILAFSLIAIMPSSAYERLTFQSDSSTVSNRAGMMKMAISMIKDHPFTGIGAGNYTRVARRYLDPSVPRSDLVLHNCFLSAWVETGILGFIAYIALYFFAAWNIYVVISESKDRFLNATAAAFMAILAAYFFYANIDPMMINERYWIFFALTVVVYNLHKAAKNSTSPEAA